MWARYAVRCLLTICPQVVPRVSGEDARLNVRQTPISTYTHSISELYHCLVTSLLHLNQRTCHECVVR
jgi:hypothetical protein